MALLELNREPSARQLRTFGAVLGLFFALVGALLFWRLHAPQVAAVVWGVGAVVVLAYYSVPSLQWPLYVAWTSAAYPIGWIVTHALLAVIFYAVLSTLGRIMRLFGRDPMQRRFEPQRASYWTKLDLGGEPSRYFRQF